MGKFRKHVFSQRNMHLRKQTFIFGLNNAFSKRLCISKRTMHEASTDFAESRCIDVSFSFKQDGDESEHVVTNMNIDIHQGLPERYILMTGWEGRGIRGPRGNRGRVPPAHIRGPPGEPACRSQVAYLRLRAAGPREEHLPAAHRPGARSYACFYLI